MWWKLILLFAGFGVSSASLNLTARWVTLTGWEVECSWDFEERDSVQSVRLLRNSQQYFVFRPETQTNRITNKSSARDFDLEIDCLLRPNQDGRCITKLFLLELEAARQEDKFECIVSGERPLFRQQYAEYTVYVPPSQAEIRSDLDDKSQTSLMCTTQGLPKPELTWTFNNVQVPEDFGYPSFWNSSSKLWLTISYYRPLSSGQVTCTPHLTTKAGQLVRGTAAQLDWPITKNKAHSLGTASFYMLTAILLLLW